MSLYFVFLRRPGDPRDRRDDPFWEYGSFGCTGCHGKNLLHPRWTRLRDGDRIAFLQGGRGEIRVVGMTPAILVRGSTARIEVRWNARYRPLPYSDAPLLVNNQGRSAFREVLPILKGTRRTTYCAMAASRFRSRTAPIDGALARQILSWFAKSNLPRIDVYADAVEPDSGRWHRHVSQQGWTNKEARQKAYETAKRATYGGLQLGANRKCKPPSTRSRACG